jgi:hypothetical protein
MDVQRNRARPPEVDKVVALDVVRFDMAVEVPRELVRHELRELLLAGAPRESARD